MEHWQALASLSRHKSRKGGHIFYDGINVVYHWVRSDPGNYHSGRHRGSLLHIKIIPALTAALAEAFLQGAVAAVSVFLLWKENERNKEK